MANGTFNLASMEELRAAKAEALGVEPQEVAVLGYTSVPGLGAVETSVLESGGVAQAGIGSGIGALLSGLGIAIPEPISTILGALGLGYLGYQALGGGEGEGIGGLNILGGNGENREELSPTGGLPVPIGGPGLAEPGKPYLVKEWHISYPKGRAQYYLVQRSTLSGRRQRFIMMYKTWDKTWSWWRLPKPILAVIGKNMPSHKMMTRLKRNLKRHTADANTILQVASPAMYARTHGYYKRKRRR